MSNTTAPSNTAATADPAAAAANATPRGRTSIEQHQGTDGPPGAACGEPPRVSTVASLRRLIPFARPAFPSLGASAVAAIAATICGLIFPLVIAWIIDGPIAHRELSQLWMPALLLIGLGVAEALLFWVRRMLATRPTMRVEATMRATFYERLQQPPVAFHDRWPAGQLMSRAVSDLSTI